MADKDKKPKKRPRGALAALQGLGSGAVQGATLGLGDEVLGRDIDFAAARAQAPIAYSVGEGLGAVLPSILIGRNLPGPMMRALEPRLGAAGAATLTGGSLGALHGGLAGLGGMTPGDMSLEDRVAAAGLMALIGGGVGGAGVAATKAGLDLYDNAPALTGRKMTEDGPVRVAPGEGTRRSAKVQVRLRGEGDPGSRAEQAMQAGLGSDEFEFVRRGDARLNRYGSQMTAFDAPVGRTTRSLVDYAAVSPAGSKAVNRQADAIVADANASYLKGAQMPKGGRSRNKIPDAQMEGLLAAWDKPEYHASWVREAKKLKPDQRLKVAQAVMDRMRADARGGNAEAVRGQLTDPQVTEKLGALGVKLTSRSRRTLLPPADAERVASLRQRATPRENPTYASSERGFANVEDRILSQQGMLSEQDALALLAAAQRTREAYLPRAVDPSRTRLLQGEWESGARFNPRGWFDATPEQMKLAITMSQPAAAMLHGVGHWGDPRPQDNEDEMERQRRMLIAMGG